MRSVSLVIAALLMGAPCATFAETPCDQFCQVIKRAVADRSNQFATLKGEKRTDVSDGWLANASPPGMYCVLIYHHDYNKILPTVTHPAGEPYWQIHCSTNEDHGQEAKKQLKSVFAAFHQNVPNWKWFKEDGDAATNYYGGPTKKELYASVSAVDLGAAGNTSFDLVSTPMTVFIGPGMKPYAP